MLDRAPFDVAHDTDDAERMGQDACPAYLETIELLERLHRLCLDVIKDELRRLGLVEITATQALLLFRIGHRELTAGELAARGYYHGTNVSYVLNKLVEGGFLHYRRHASDGRAVLISLTDRGNEVRETVAELFRRHAQEVEVGAGLPAGRLAGLSGALRRLERFWVERRLTV